jgi:hypothetical protein
MDSLGIDTRRFKRALDKFERKQLQYIDYMYSLLSRRNGGSSPQRVAPELQQIELYDSKGRMERAAIANVSNEEVILAGNGPQEPLKISSEYALAPIIDNPRSTPLLQGQAARRPMSLAESNAEAAEAKARLRLLPGGDNKRKGRAPLVTEQGLRPNRAFLKIDSALFREAVTALAEELATKKTIESYPEERLIRLCRLLGSKTRDCDAC